MDKEEWRTIRWADGYEVSNYGRVRSWFVLGSRIRRRLETPKVMKTLIGTNGRPKVILKGHWGYKNCEIHVLMLEAFVGDRPPGHVARHLDDDKTNNVLTNLVWGTRKENVEDARRNGRMACGERCKMAKLKYADVVSIRARYEGGESQGRLARIFGVGQSHISRICRRENWK